MTIEIRTVSSPADFRQFILLPAQIHKGHRNWLPNMLADEKLFFDPERNPSFEGCDTFMAMATRKGKATGRIMGIINHQYNDLKNKKDARFFGLETYNDPETVHALLHFAEDWARRKGCSRMIGPYGFSDKDPQGYLVDGFNVEPIIVSACNFPYQVELLEKEGYTKEVDCTTFIYDVGNSLPQVYERVFERLSRRADIEIVEFSNKKNLRKYIVPVFTLMNEAYADIYGFVPMKEEEMHSFAARYMPILNPDFIKVVKVNGEMAAFILGIPCLTKGIQQAGGRLFPFGFYHILRAARSTRKLDLMLGAVKSRYRGTGLEVSMAISLLNSVKKAGFTEIEVHLVLETNKPMLAEMERAGAKPNKRFRVFQKDLGQ